MIVKKLTASFGGLERASLTLGPGLNVLEGPNEGGKSTWAAFLRVMLYGLDTRSRDKKGHLADKNRFRPWSGAPMEGVLECTWKGKNVTLRRWTKGAVPMGAFSAVWTDTGEPVEGMTGETAGEQLTGVGEETFVRSAFLGQSSLVVDQAPELEKRIAALVSSGEEGVSYTDTQERLKKWLRRRQYRGSGLIPRLEEEQGKLTAALADLEDSNRVIVEAQAQISQLLGEEGALRRSLELHRQARRRKLDQEYSRAAAELREARAAEETLKAEMAKFGPIPTKERLRQAQSELAFLRTAEENWKQAKRAVEEAGQQAEEARDQVDDRFFPGQTAEEAAVQAARDQAFCQTPVTKGPAFWLGAAGAAAALVGAGVCFFRELTIPAVGCGAAAAALAVLAVWAWQQSRKALGERQRVLEQYRAAAPEEILERAAEYQRQWAELRQAEARREQAAQGAEEWKEQLEQGKAALFGFVYTFAPEVHTLMGVSAAISRALGLEDKLSNAAQRRQNAQEKADFLAAQGGRETRDTGEVSVPAQSVSELNGRLEGVESALTQVRGRLAMAQGEQKALGDPAELNARLEETEGSLDQLREECQAIEAALSALEAANQELQSRFSPALNARAGELLSALTDGRYDKVHLDRSFDAEAQETGALVPRPVLALSQGTADQVYLAVRLAICTLVLPEEEPSPLVLDDALTNFDDHRLALALEVLRGLGEERQILLFTCHSREGRLLEGKEGVVVNRLKGGVEG